MQDYDKYNEKFVQLSRTSCIFELYLSVIRFLNKSDKELLNSSLAVSPISGCSIMSHVLNEILFPDYN